MNFKKEVLGNTLRNEVKAMTRPFNRTDLHALHRMICETIDTSYSGVYPPRAVAFFKEHHSEKNILDRSTAGEILVLISEGDGSILATGSLIGSEIIGVFVRPDHQGQGYGKAIMTQLEQIAMEKEILRLSLSISLPSKRFYEYLGYKVLDECVLDVGGGECLKYLAGEKGLHPRTMQKPKAATVEIVKTAGDATEIDELLWCVLWQPLGLPRDIRSDFNIGGEKLELAAKQDGVIVGGLVAVWTAENEIELRHLAVASGHQRKGIGQELIAELCRIASCRMCLRIHTITRNTSADFFRTVGFQAAIGKAPEHPVFLEHGITFKLIEKIVEQAASPDHHSSVVP